MSSVEKGELGYVCFLDTVHSALKVNRPIIIDVSVLVSVQLFLEGSSKLWSFSTEEDFSKDILTLMPSSPIMSHINNGFQEVSNFFTKLSTIITYNHLIRFV